MEGRCHQLERCHKMKLSMSSIHHWARSPKPLPDDLGFDPCKDTTSFSWSGIKLFVDLQIENVENVGQTLIVDHAIPHDRDPADDEPSTKEPGSTLESSSSLQHGTDAVEDHLRDTNHQNDETGCNRQSPSEGEGTECGAAAETDANWTHCKWPDWGEPLPPEDLDDEMDVEYAADGESNPNVEKSVTFSDVVTFVEPSILQEERETDSFSYAGSSDEELEQGTDQVMTSSDGNSGVLLPVSCSTDKGSLNSADVSAACHLLELGNESNQGDSKAIGFEPPGGSGQQRKSEFYDPSSDLERLSELVEKIYAAVPQLSIVSDSQGSVSSQDVGLWTIEISKDSGRLRMKKTKREKEAQFQGLGLLDLGDDNEVLGRPLWKRQYKSLNKFLRYV